MIRYSVFGRTLGSALPLPELDVLGTGSPEWTVVISDTAPAALPADAWLAGSECIYDDVCAALHRHAGGWRVQVADTGVFDWREDRREVRCWKRPGGTVDFLRAHLLGRVLATVLHDEGFLVLHASAVVTRGGAVGFLAPKGFGKSTLALALAVRGAPLLTDDALPVTCDDPPVAWPGVPSLRLRPDAAATLSAVVRSPPRADGKHLASIPAGRLAAHAPARLAALYLLIPASGIDDGSSVAPAPLPATSALSALMGHCKIGEMLGPAAAPELLRRAHAVVRRVPVQGLVVTRDLDRLGEAAEAILAWHGGPVPGTFEAGA